MFRITTFVFAGLLFALVANALKESPSETFKRWKAENNKTYTEKSSKTESAAQKTFEKNKAAIEKHNKDPEVTYTQKANSHSDLTPEEFKKYRTGDKVPENEDKKKGAKDMSRYRSENNKAINNESSNIKSTKSESTVTRQSTTSNNMKSQKNNKSEANKTSSDSNFKTTKSSDIKSTPASKSKNSTIGDTQKTTSKTSPNNNKIKSSTGKVTKSSTSKTSPSNKSSTTEGSKTTATYPSKKSSEATKTSASSITRSPDIKHNNTDPNSRMQHSKPSNGSSGSSQPRNFDKTKADKSEHGRMDVPISLDFSTMMPPVKDQGMCGCCWAFATVALLEYWSAKNKTNKRYSEQNLVECSTINCNGCNGGSTLDALAYVMDNGIAESSGYAPYKQANGTCQKDIYPPSYFLPNMGYAYVDGDEDFLKELMIKFGPMTVSIDALGSGFMAYSSGVYQSPTCTNETNHAVLAVGFGTDPDGGDFWLIRNSWGSSWGMNGYGKIARNSGNMCGIATRARILLN